MHILDLSDDLLRALLVMCISHQAFLAPVCSKFRVLLNENSYPMQKRKVNLSSIFCSLDCMKEYIHRENVIRMCADRHSHETKNILAWKNDVKKLVLKKAPLQVVCHVWDEFKMEDQSSKATTTLHEIFESGRTDVLDFVMENTVTMFEYLQGVIAELSQTSQEPIWSMGCIKCASVGTFRWLVDKVFDKMSLEEIRDCGLVTLLKDFRKLRSILFAMAGSSTAYELIDSVCMLMIQYTPFSATFMKPLVFAIVASSTRKLSASAWRWLEREAVTVDSETLFDNYYTKCPSGVVQDLKLEVPKGGTHLMKLDDFRTNDCESYKIVSKGIREGGFLHRTFIKIAGHKISLSNFTSVCLFRELSRGVFTGNHTKPASMQDVEELLSETVYDVMLESLTGYDEGSATMIRRNFNHFVERFPFASYSVCKRLCSHPDRGIHQKALNMLYEGRYIDTCIKECALYCFSRVIDDFVKNASTFEIHRLSKERSAVVLKAMISQNRGHQATMDMIGAFLPYCSVNAGHVKTALSIDKFEVAKLLLRNCEYHTKLMVGENALASMRPSIKAVEILLSNGCFARDSVQEKEAVNLISDHAYSNYPPQLGRKRKLPFAALQMSVAFQR